MECISSQGSAAVQVKGINENQPKSSPVSVAQLRRQTLRRFLIETTPLGQDARDVFPQRRVCRNQ
ncbi:hypothetical protein PISMIDRAFT_145198 [Pisolithus microcarpus 441]|uniref:Uncharacterized protein n=1 Tax=Pisolithus microcarpus 441 TaxID=765257 RepID=A0A0C9ZPC5_9AGAM|nr:hypothetical protein PISMIDRAFT_145198 [Pisolithus microcarpus 441]